MKNTFKLAALTAALKNKVRRWMDYILTHQQPDGWLGPIQSKDRHAYDPWPIFIILKAMMQYAQAENDRRVVPAMRRCAEKLNALLDEKPLFDWAAPRWGELLLSACWIWPPRRIGRAWTGQNIQSS